MIEFRVSCVPPRTTAQQKRAVRTTSGIRFFKGKAQQAAENTLEAILLPHQPRTPIDGIVALTVDVEWPWRASDCNTKAKRSRNEECKRIPSGSKPDLDNAVKAIQDCLVALRFIERDELVAELHVRKFFGANPGIGIKIDRLGGEAT